MTHTGRRVRNRRHAEARRNHPARTSLVVPGPVERAPRPRPPEPAPVVAQTDAPSVSGVSAPALALLAAIAIFEGYRWLHLIPGSPSVPGALVFAAVAGAVTLGLTRPSVWTHARPPRQVARASSYTLVGAALLVGVVDVPVTDRILGAASLVLAVAALAGAVSGRQRRPGDPGRSGPR